MSKLRSAQSVLIWLRRGSGVDGWSTGVVCSHESSLPLEQYGLARVIVLGETGVDEVLVVGNFVEVVVITG